VLFWVILVLGLLPAIFLRAQSPLPDGFDPGVNGPIYAFAVQGDGKVLVGGQFTTLAGQLRNNLGRLNPDGTLDVDFNPGVEGGFSASVSSLQIQADGKILVGGTFSTLGGQPRSGLGRLNMDGTVDGAFAPAITGSSSSVYALALQADGKILLGGYFSQVAGSARTNLARLNANGTLDTAFNRGIDGSVACLALQANGSILVGGSFTLLNLEGGDLIAYFNMVRLSTNGVVDQGFYPDPDNAVTSMVVQPDGKILVAGDFTILDSGTTAAPRAGLGRFNANSTVDTAFNPGQDGEVNSMVLQTDGKIIVGGTFNTLAGQPRSRIGRLNANGTIDSTFNPGADGEVVSLAIQADGKVLAAGPFANLGGQPRSRLGRLTNTTAATNTLNYSGTTVTWSRGGTSPEVLRTTFEYSSNGTAWVNLGAGTRIAGGWQRTSATVPAGATIRARGTVAGGSFNASGWFDEAYRGKPVFLSQPVSLTNEVGSAATFTAGVGGTGPLSYQWQKGGVPLMDQGNVTGVSTPSLTLNPVAITNEGIYRLIASNSFGSATSSIAILTVVPFGPLAEAVDATSLLWTTGGGLPWIAQTNVTFDGQDSAQSGLISHNQESWIQTTVNGPGVVSFRWKVSSEASWDFLEFYINGGLQSGRISGEVNWQQRTLSVGDGSQTLRWRYVKDEVISAGQDRGWLDTFSFVPATNGPVILTQPQSQSVGEGTNVTFSVNAIGAAPLTYQWFFGTNVLSGAVSSNLALFNVSKADAGKYSVFISDANGSVTSAPAFLTVNLAVLDAAVNQAAGNAVYSFVPRTDGKMLVAGIFTNLGGQPRQYIGRLNADGTLDDTFNPGADQTVYSLLIQRDGKVLVGGVFTNLAGQVRKGIGRLNENGTLDQAFAPPGIGFVTGMAAQPDGRILITGAFTNSFGYRFIGRLHSNGTHDDSFSSNPGYPVHTMAIQEDRKILIGGGFSSVDGQARSFLARLNTNGTLDASFNPGANGVGVYALAVQPDGKVVVGGAFTNLAGQPRTNIGRLHGDGSLDDTFNPGVNGSVSSIALQADGKILLGGSFATLGGQVRVCLGRLHPDGTVDNTFNPGASSSVLSLGLQPDGKILAGGVFTTLAGQPRSRLGRIINTDPTSDSLTLANGTISWLRGGTGPEVYAALFEHSVDGLNWSTLGVGARVPGGWHLTGASPSAGTVRAIGYVSGGWDNASGYTVSSTLPVMGSIQLSLGRNGSSVSLNWTGGPGTYQVQQTTNLTPPVVWQDVGGPMQSNSMSVPIGPDSLFLRVVRP
jgi:uncharacterized delta-60 repeat protein